MHPTNKLKWQRAVAAAGVEATQEAIEALYTSYGGSFEAVDDEPVEDKPKKKSK